MKMMKIYEKLWIVASFTALVVMIWNAISNKRFDHHVYFPLMVCITCMIMYFTKKNHRIFMEKMREKQNNKTAETSNNQEN